MLSAISEVSKLRIKDRVMSLHCFYNTYSYGLVLTSDTVVVPSMKHNLDLALKEMTMTSHQVE